MQKICAIILLTALASEALPQTKWSRPIRQLTRERRQFPFGEWIPLSQPCPTCRPFADPLDVGLRGENIGLTPPRPPTVTRQIHGEGNFFPQDESSILSVPPPPPSAIPRQPNGNFQFSSFGQQFNNPLPVPTQKIFPQTQQIQFLPQSFLPNQTPLLVNGNQQILSGINNQGNLLIQDHNQQQITNGKINGFNSEFKTQKIPENVVLEQNNRQVGAKQTFTNKPQPFSPPSQNQQQTFVQQQTFGGQQQHSVNFGDSILTPPPAPKNVTQDIVIPGLDKEEIQLLYVPVETLRQRGTPQEQQLLTQQQNVQFFNRGNGLKRPVNNVRPTEQTIVTQQKGHFVTQNGNGQGQSDSSLKVTSSQPFPTTVTPSSLLLQHLPFQQTPQPFVSATPATPTIQPFVTPASAFQKFSSFTPETTLSHLSTVPNNIQFSQSDFEFGTTPKTITNQGVFKEEIINGKSQFSGLKNIGFTQDQPRPFVNQQTVTQQPITTVFSQEQQEVLTPTHFPQQIDQQQIALQKQQEQQRLLQQQRQKEIEEQRILEQNRKQKELEEQRALQQQQHQKELEEQRILQQQQRQKELEEQRFIQKQKELEEQRLLQQQRQKELEQQRFLQKQKELEEQRLLQQQRQKELEEQKFLQEQRQKELENQRRLQLQRQKELEEKRRIQQKQKEEEQRLLRFQQQQKQKEEEQRLLRFQQQQKQKEEEQRLLRFQQQQKQKEEEQRLLRFQQQQKELEQQRLLQKQQEEQQRALQLQKQKQENLKKQQQFQLFKQQQQQIQQNFPQQAFQQPNRHVLPANDKLNFIPQLEKETESEDQQLVPHQPPLSVFYRGQNAGESRITDVLRELRSSNTITVLDQYFEKMPKVFVGPAGLIPPSGYNKFELPYLSNLETNRIERKIGQLPFFVAPLNFVPPPGYAKIPFPAPHIGSVVVSSESNPAMTTEKGVVEEENVSGGFPVVGPELPGLINNLNKETTTEKPVTYVSTPSLPQTTAQLRNRRPTSSLYKPQTRKPITRTRPTTTSKPEEEVTQPIQKTEKDTEGGFKKPFNRFLNRRRQQTKTTTETPLKTQQDGKNLENRFYSVEVYHQEKNQVPRTQQKSDVINEKQTDGNRFQQQFEHGSTIDRITPSGHGVFEVRPTPDFSQAHSSEERSPEIPDYADVNLQSFEDGPLPTGSAKTITQELYRPNAVAEGELNAKTLSKSDSTLSSAGYQSYEDVNTRISEPSPTAAGTYSVSEGQVNVQPSAAVEYEKSEVSSDRYESTEAPTQVTATEEQQTKGFLDSNEQYTSAFAEISKPHHIPGFVDSSQRQYSKFADVSPTPEISVDFQAPQQQDFEGSAEVKTTQSSETPNKFSPTASSNEQYISGVSKNQQNFYASQVSPTAPGSTAEYTSGFSVNSQNSGESHGQFDDQRIGSFISVHDVHSMSGSPVSQEYVPGSTAFPSPTPATDSNNEHSISPVSVEQTAAQFSSTPQTAAEVTVNPSVQTYTSGPGAESFSQVSDQTSEGHGQDFANNLPNDHRLKFPNPSIVRVRTRVRGKSRGQVNFAASHSTTPVPFTRSTTENKHNENTEKESTTKTNHFRDFHPVKTSKFNQFRGTKKPSRTTTEPTTEHEQRANIYTIRPPRRPLNPSTVSTKRIRRPTTPLPSAESSTEPSPTYQQSEHSDISPSGVSNDVYYEQSSLSPVKHKFRKHFGSAEQKNDVVPSYISTSFPSASPTYSTFSHEDYSEESNIVTSEPPQRYPEWNPSESGFDVSGIVLTTIRTPGQQEEDQPEAEEPKKSQDSKKAFDPDLEKKTGRRRVRVRVHKRPHENFETAESQNLRTVANVLVPPTSTYKPNDESNFHQLAKNTDFSFGGQKLFGVRSREYFRKRLNLTQTEGEQTGEGQTVEGKEKSTELKSFVRKTEKAQKNDFESTSSENGEAEGKLTRPKFRGYVRKVIKHGGVVKEADSESNQLEVEEGEGKHENGEFHLRQSFRGGFNHTGRGNGTRHKTLVRFVKKNKIRPHDAEPVQESNIQESQKEEQIHKITQTETPTIQTESQTTQQPHEEGKLESQSSVETQQQTESIESQQPETTVEPEVKQTQQPSIQTTQTAEIEESSSQATQEPTSDTPQPSSPVTQLTGLYLTQRPKFYQTLRPVFQRTTPTASPRTREPEPSTEQNEQQEKRTGFVRLKYGKTTGFGQTGSEERSEETKKTTEQEQHDPQERREGLTRVKYGRPTTFGATSSGERSEESKRTEQEQNEQEKQNGFTRFKYGKTTGFGQTGSAERSDEIKKTTEQEHDQQERREGFTRFKYGKPTSFGATGSGERFDERKKTEQEQTEKEKQTGFTRLKYGKTSGFGQTGSTERSDETKKTTEQEHDQQERREGFTRFKYGKPTSYGATGSGERFDESKKTEQEQTEKEKQTGFTRLKYGKTTGFEQTGSAERSDETKTTEQEVKNKNLHTLEVRKYLRTKNREGAFSQFSKNKYFTSKKTETFGTTTDQEIIDQESEDITTEKAKLSSTEPKPTEPITESRHIETTVNEDTELPASTTETITSSEEDNSEEDNSEEDVTSSEQFHTTTETEVPTTIFHPTTTPEITEPKIPAQTTESTEPQRTEYEPDIYRFSKNSFSFDETQQFTGTKNRAHVRNITTDIIENTASFSAPGVEKRPEIHIVTHRSDEQRPTEPQKTETESIKLDTTDSIKQETTTDYPESTETETAAPTDGVTKSKIAKVLKTSTTTKISHETEICYRGKCIRTKSENPDEDLKLLVDSASIMKIEKTKT